MPNATRRIAAIQGNACTQGYANATRYIAAMLGNDFTLGVGATGWIPRRRIHAQKDGADEMRRLRTRSCRSLEHEGRRLGEARQRRGCGIEHRVPAEIAVDAAVEHGLAIGAAAKHANETPAILELIE
jgi:hypothetical protein